MSLFKSSIEPGRNLPLKDAMWSPQLIRQVKPVLTLNKGQLTPITAPWVLAGSGASLWRVSHPAITLAEAEVLGPKYSPWAMGWSQGSCLFPLQCSLLVCTFPLDSATPPRLSSTMPWIEKQGWRLGSTEWHWLKGLRLSRILFPILIKNCL